ncbi:TetR/AcrR family transcriptional regulator [Williamsia sp. 1135]|uniref:TetR/AcrR family transcriptional regulator n=1 Tax=Williamsia sp. 1135 TaxID=1889262 RepID=UPI000A0F91FD|nr:TetR/AcrR family transcriptional regulator [Williamsia sp. 1135]ORM27788.1 TetR family transcriptional regulator [Williamsia sp. 1135]
MKSGPPREPAFTTAAIRDSDDPTARVILSAAVQMIAARGYHGTSVRDIAGFAGISAGSIYNHFGSKHELLVTILARGGEALVEATEQALLAAPADPVHRLDAIVRTHVGVHAENPLESYIGNSELRSLDPVALERVIANRDAQQRIFDRVVADGVRRGEFRTDNPVEASRFVVTACTAVAMWFRPGGQATEEQVIARYQAVARDAVGHRAG